MDEVGKRNTIPSPAERAKPDDDKQPDPNNITQLQMQCMEDSARWFPSVAPDLVYQVLALAGEVGELANIVKKVERGDFEMSEEVWTAMVDEATDSLIYILNVFGVLNADSGGCYHAKRDFNEKRFGGNNDQPEE